MVKELIEAHATQDVKDAIVGSDETQQDEEGFQKARVNFGQAVHASVYIACKLLNPFSRFPQRSHTHSFGEKMKRALLHRCRRFVRTDTFNPGDENIFGLNVCAPVGDGWNNSSMAFEPLPSLVNRHAKL